MTQLKPPRPLEKADVVRILLNQEGRVMLCLDATCSGVAVPRRFASDQGLRLILNIQMPQPIHIGANAIESELRFGGIPHYCIIPYQALWGAYNPDTGHGMLWRDSMPEEVLRQHPATDESISWQDDLVPKPLTPKQPGAATESATVSPRPRRRQPKKELADGGIAPVIPIMGEPSSGKPKLKLVSSSDAPPDDLKSVKKHSKPNLKLVE
ncbi:MAG: hypothetical protein HQL58_07280 [Magnetococcales bacterium]|nr:hypothetical protein [Magnetococcales bacterium]